MSEQSSSITDPAIQLTVNIHLLPSPPSSNPTSMSEQSSSITDPATIQHDVCNANYFDDLSSGFKVPFDNFDIYQRVREMTEDNQNIDIHWVNHNSVTNRVSGNDLSDAAPICDILEVNNAKLLPNMPDHMMQRENYIVLVERVLTEELPYLGFCKDAVVRHIPHRHSREMSKKSEKVSLKKIV